MYAFVGRHFEESKFGHMAVGMTRLVRLFGHWMIIYIGQVFNNRSSPHFETTFSTVQVMYVLFSWAKKRVGRFVEFFQKLIRGRCHDHNFMRFSSIFVKKIGVPLKNQCYDPNYATTGPF
jgi:hypothetical protein